MSEKTITLTDQEWLVVDEALQLMPFGRVAPIYNRMNAQFAEQQPAQVVEPDTEVEDELWESLKK